MRRYHRDYQRVNRILEQSVAECADVLMLVDRSLRGIGSALWRGIG